MLKKIRNVAVYAVCSLGITITTDVLAVETGLASYYSDKFQGRKTASGERYDRNKLTAAHRTLPIGSQIEIINLKNQNSVIVTINDRGPYSGSRKLDLSYAAAKELGLVAAGVAPVTFDVVTPQKNNDFENIIPHEYSPGVLGVKSEEEVIEAEEELADSEPAANAEINSEEEPETHHQHKTKKITAKLEKTSQTSKKNHATANEKAVKSKKTAKSDKSDQLKSAKSKKVAKSDKKVAKNSKKTKAS